MTSMEMSIRMMLRRAKTENSDSKQDGAQPGPRHRYSHDPASSSWPERWSDDGCQSSSDVAPDGSANGPKSAAPIAARLPKGFDGAALCLVPGQF